MDCLLDVGNSCRIKIDCNQFIFHELVASSTLHTHACSLNTMRLFILPSLFITPIGQSPITSTVSPNPAIQALSTFLLLRRKPNLTRRTLRDIIKDDIEIIDKGITQDIDTNAGARL